LFYAVVNILGGSVYTVKKNTESLVVVSEEIGLKANGDKLSISRLECRTKSQYEDR